MKPFPDPSALTVYLDSQGLFLEYIQWVEHDSIYLPSVLVAY
ncbi:MAG: hypothetical protein ACK5G8_00065 [Flavobacteriales bacterium]